MSLLSTVSRHPLQSSLVRDSDNLGGWNVAYGTRHVSLSPAAASSYHHRMAEHPGAVWEKKGNNMTEQNQLLNEEGKSLVAEDCFTNQDWNRE